MEFVELGASGVHVSRVIFGAMTFGSQSTAACIRTLHAALDAGVTSVDTAPLYGFGESERWVGHAVAGRRPTLQLLTKVGLSWDAEHGEVLFEFQDDGGQQRAVRKDSRPRKIRAEVEASLQRLATDYLDLIQVHQLDVHTPLHETLAELELLRSAGKVRAIGVSNFGVASLRQARAALGSQLVSHQCELNLLNRANEREVVPWCRAHAVAVLAYSPLAQGLLAGRSLTSGTPSDWRAQGALFKAPNLELIERTLRECVSPIAQRHGVGLGDVALSWLLAQPGVSAVITGASSPAQAQSNARALELHLDASELQLLENGFGRLRLIDTEPRSGRQLLKRLVRRLRGIL